MNGDWYWWSGYNAEILRWQDTDGRSRITHWKRVTVGDRTGIAIFIPEEAYRE